MGSSNHRKLGGNTCRRNRLCFLGSFVSAHFIDLMTSCCRVPALLTWFHHSGVGWLPKLSGLPRYPRRCIHVLQAEMTAQKRQRVVTVGAQKARQQTILWNRLEVYLLYTTFQNLLSSFPTPFTFFVRFHARWCGLRCLAWEHARSYIHESRISIP